MNDSGQGAGIPATLLLEKSVVADPYAFYRRLVAEAPDRALCRINPIAFAARHHLDEERVIAAFLHAARLVFTHPTDSRRMEFTTPLPPDLLDVLDDLPGWNEPA